MKFWLKPITKALRTCALFSALLVACSSTSSTPTHEPTLAPTPTATPKPTDTPPPTPTPDLTVLEAELVDFLAQQICDSFEYVQEVYDVNGVNSAPEPITLARVSNISLPRDVGHPGAGHALQAWECHPDLHRLVDVETTQFSTAYRLAQGDPCESVGFVEFFSLDSLTTIEANATVCGRSTFSSSCSQWLVKRTDSQWEAESKTLVQWLSPEYLCP